MRYVAELTTQLKHLNQFLDDLNYIQDFSARRAKAIAKIDKALASKKLSKKQRKKLLKKRGRTATQGGSSAKQGGDDYFGLHVAFKNIIKRNSVIRISMTKSVIVTQMKLSSIRRMVETRTL